MKGPCMCGDLCCPSCGPAQGNWRCPICNAWASEACDHIDEETGKLKAEFVAEAEARAKAELAIEEIGAYNCERSVKRNPKTKPGRSGRRNRKRSKPG